MILFLCPNLSRKNLKQLPLLWLKPTFRRLTKVFKASVTYVDESGMDERDNYGYSPIGEQFHAMKSGRCQGRVNMIAGYRDEDLIAPFTVEGSCHRMVFEVWLESCLIP